MPQSSNRTARTRSLVVSRIPPRLTPKGWDPRCRGAVLSRRTWRRWVFPLPGRTTKEPATRCQPARSTHQRLLSSRICRQSPRNIGKNEGPTSTSKKRAYSRRSPNSRTKLTALSKSTISSTRVASTPAGCGQTQTIPERTNTSPTARAQ